MTAVATAPTLPGVSDAAATAAADRDVQRFIAAISEIPVISRFQSVAGAPGEVSVAPAALALPRIDEEGLLRRERAAEPILADIVDKMRRVEDVIDRVVACQTLVDVIDVHAKRVRYERDIALLIMLGPWYDAQRRYRLDKAALDEEFEHGQISREQFDERLDEIEATRRTASGRVKWRPTPAARMAGVSRGLLASRVAPRMPAEVPTGSLTEAEDTAAHAGSLVKQIDALRVEIEQIRNKAIDLILSGPPRGLGWSNASLARLLGVTTARVAQLRLGTR